MIVGVGDVKQSLLGIEREALRLIERASAPTPSALPRVFVAPAMDRKRRTTPWCQSRPSPWGIGEAVPARRHVWSLGL
jgi:hypothetical protein